LHQQKKMILSSSYCGIPMTKDVLAFVKQLGCFDL
jgi:hypothetical protein